METVKKDISVEVIGAGWGRTGTMSLKAALNTLGYKAYHMTEAMENGRGDIKVWARAGRGEHMDFAELLRGYSATTDFPACIYYKELLRLNPSGKVILTVRDPESWFQSCSETIFHFEDVFKATYLLRFFPPIANMSSTMADVFARPVFGDHRKMKDREFCVQRFKEHIEEVKRVVPADQLLIFEVKQGWEPLCKFLGKPIPSTPFPNVNDTKEFKQHFTMVQRIDLLLVILSVVAPLGLGYLAKSYFF